MSNPAVPFAAGAADGSLTGPESSMPVQSGIPAQLRTPAGRWIPVVVLLVLGTACLIAVIPLYRQGVAGHAFPSYVEGDPSYRVQRYSAPWIAGALALAGLGIVFWLVGIARIVTTRPRPAPAARPSSYPNSLPPDPVQQRSEALEPRPSEAAREY